MYPAGVGIATGAVRTHNARVWTTPVARAARPPGLPPPRHPALGFAPQNPNVMLPHVKRLVPMPPWCPLLAAAVGADISARRARPFPGAPRNASA